jgi:hypothetical protein
MTYTVPQSAEFQIWNLQFSVPQSAEFQIWNLQFSFLSKTKQHYATKTDDIAP